MERQRCGQTEDEEHGVTDLPLTLAYLTSPQLRKDRFGMAKRPMFGNTVGRSVGDTPNQRASVAAY